MRRKQYYLAGQTGSIAHHARRFSVIPETVRSRMRKGKTLPESIHQSAHGNAKPLYALGESLSVQQWSERTQISVACLKSRLRRGWSPDEAVSSPPDGVPLVRDNRERVFEWQGEEYNIAELVRVAPIEIRHEQLRRRLVVYRWPLEKAMTTPVRVYKRQDK